MEVRSKSKRFPNRKIAMSSNTMRGIGLGVSVVTGPILGYWGHAILQIIVTEWYVRRRERAEMYRAAFPYAVQALIIQLKLNEIRSKSSLASVEV
jgi:hypothetical protein